MSYIKKISLILIFILICFNNYSLTDTKKEGWLVPATFCRPFVSEMESTLTKMEIGFGRASDDYFLKDTITRKFVAFLNISLGINGPIYLKKLKRNWTIACSIPISFHLWLDLESFSAPVINTDYRFAVGELKILKEYPNNRFLKNFSVRFAPLNHESTHIGDELSLLRVKYNVPIKRVNVSYEYSELSITLNDRDGSQKASDSYRIGVIAALPWYKQYYKIEKSEGDINYNQNTRKLIEFYAQYEMQRDRGWLASQNWKNVFSIELRNRFKYAYPAFKYNSVDTSLTLKQTNYERTWNVNMYFGWRTHPKSVHLLNSIGLYLHGYYGIVPYGQFRNVTNYLYGGISLVIFK